MATTKGKGFELNLTDEQLSNYHVRIPLTAAQKEQIKQETGMEVDSVEVPWKHDDARAPRLILSHKDMLCW